VLSAAGAPAAAFENFEPWFVGHDALCLAAQKLGLSPSMARGSAEAGRQAAQHAGRRARGHGNADAPAGRHPEPLQLAFLRESLAYMDKVGTLITPMQAAWYDAMSTSWCG
jgi:hypothetical protein